MLTYVTYVRTLVGHAVMIELKAVKVAFACGKVEIRFEVHTLETHILDRLNLFHGPPADGSDGFAHNCELLNRWFIADNSDLSFARALRGGAI